MNIRKIIGWLILGAFFLGLMGVMAIVGGWQGVVTMLVMFAIAALLILGIYLVADV